jgi:hypothetical protein
LADHLARLLAEQGTEADIRAEERFAAFMEADRALWHGLITRVGLQPI